MRNVWKGLVVGGLTGVTAGVVLDSIASASKRASELGEQFRSRAPEAGRLAQSLTEKAIESNGAERVRNVAQRVKESEAADRVAQLGRDADLGSRESCFCTQPLKWTESRMSLSR